MHSVFARVLSHHPPSFSVLASFRYTRWNCSFSSPSPLHPLLSVPSSCSLTSFFLNSTTPSTKSVQEDDINVSYLCTMAGISIPHPEDVIQFQSQLHQFLYLIHHHLHSSSSTPNLSDHSTATISVSDRSTVSLDQLAQLSSSALLDSDDSTLSLLCIQAANHVTPTMSTNSMASSTGSSGYDPTSGLFVVPFSIHKPSK